RDITAWFPNFLGFREITVMSSREVWLLSPTGVYRMSGWQSGASPSVQLLDFPRANQVFQIFRPRDGSLWTAGPGVSRLEWTPGGQLAQAENYSTREGLPGPGSVELLAEDRQGNLWGAIDGSGIFRIADTGFRTYSSEDGLGSARMASIFEDLRGDLCVMT